MSDIDATHAPTVAMGEVLTGAILHIRLRLPDGGGVSYGQHKNPSPLVCLVTDILSASGGVASGTSGESMSAYFPDFQAGVLAARRIQWAAQGFSEGKNLSESSVSILVQQGEDALGVSSEDGIPSELEQVAPGQILLAEKAGKLVEEMAGFSLADPSQEGLRELLWCAPGERRTREADEAALSRFVELKGPDASSMAYPGTEAPDTSTKVLGAEDHPGDRSQQADGEDSVLGRILIHKTIWIIGLAAAALILIAVLVFHSSAGTSRNNPAPAANAPASGATGGEQTTSSPVQSSASKVPESSSAKEASRRDLKRAEQQKNKNGQNTAKVSQAAPEQKPSRPVVQSRENCYLEQNQIGGQLDQAEASLARGRYKDALRQFGSVLACEPGNSRAVEGVNRARLAQSTEDSAP